MMALFHYNQELSFFHKLDDIHRDYTIMGVSPRMVSFTILPLPLLVDASSPFDLNHPPK